MSLTTVPQSDVTHALDRGMSTAADVVGRVRRIQEVMKAVMKDGTHYGQIPGTNKPTLLKPGAEVILSTFRIAAIVSLTEDLSTEDAVRYRVTVRGVNQSTGEVLGEMVGECSSDEEKYRWRRPVCQEEWDETPDDRRRSKWQKRYGGDGHERVNQIRTSPPDVANTVLKMATKRAMIAMTLVVTAASDIFNQDLEDLPAEIRDDWTAPRGTTGGHDDRSGGLTSPSRRNDPALPAGAYLVANVSRVQRDGWKNAKFDVKFSDGKIAGTFKQELGALAERCWHDRTPVQRVLESKGRFNDLMELSIAHVAAEASDAQDDEREPGSDDE